MKIINYLADLLFRHQKKLEITAILLLCFTISFRFTNSRTVWLWSNSTYIAVILVVILIVTALVWIQIEKNKTRNLIERIRNESETKNPNTENQFDGLTARQKQVFDLIKNGKSNKEIMNELSIELSTLKTHINKLNKTLRIDSRKQLRKHKIR
jgi:DNA-binding CsgD family transcriptional regulator